MKDTPLWHKVVGLNINATSDTSSVPKPRNRFVLWDALGYATVMAVIYFVWVAT